MTTMKFEDTDAAEDVMVHAYQHIHAHVMSKIPEQRQYGLCMRDLMPLIERFVKMNKEGDSRELTDLTLAAAKALPNTMINVAGVMPTPIAATFFVMIIFHLYEGLIKHPNLNPHQELFRRTISLTALGKRTEADELIDNEFPISEGEP